MNSVLGISSKVRDAYLFAYRHHSGQKDLMGNDYMIHIEYVTCLVAKYTSDYDTIVAAILHDILRNTKVVIADIIKLFGEDVGSIVYELNNDKNYDENFALTINFLSKEAFLIKLASMTYYVYCMSNDVTLPNSYIESYISDLRYTLDNLNRKLNRNHKELIKLLEFMMFTAEFKKQI